MAAHSPRLGAGLFGDQLLCVRLDGKPPAARGVDVDEQGMGTVDEPRMYQLIRQQHPIADRDLQIEFSGEAVEGFSFTFG